MTPITDLDTLDALYGAPATASLDKVSRQLTPLYTRWIEASRFVVLSTVGPEGTDASPRGDDGPVARIADPRTILIPDWRGNNRLDSLRNIVVDGRASLMFLVPGSDNVVRVNGHAEVSADEALTGTFEQRGAHPRSVIVFTVAEVYFQCAKAVMRADLWARDDAAGLPTAGQFLKEQKEDFDAPTYDAGYAAYARSRMW